jgi:hypothetical protein
LWINNFVGTTGESTVKAKIQKVLFFVLVAALIALGVRAGVPKKAGPQVWTPGCVSTVPRSWGQFKGGSAQSGLAFEDPAGTLRFVTNIPCDGTSFVALEISRTPGASANGSN